MQATWDQFAKRGYWIKPGAAVKQRTTHVLPLNPPAIELLERVRETRTEGEALVFPGVSALASVWRHVRKHAGFGPGERLYDARHSFASVGGAGGLSLPIIGALLGHSSPKTTSRYVHLVGSALQEATNKIGAVVARAGKAGARVEKIGRG